MRSLRRSAAGAGSVLIAAVLLGGAISLGSADAPSSLTGYDFASDDTGVIDSSPEPAAKLDPSESARNRLAAARASKAAEDERVAKSRATWEDAAKNRPEERAPFLVSFSEAVAASDLLSAIRDVGPASTGPIYFQLTPDSADHPIVSYIDYALLDARARETNRTPIDLVSQFFERYFTQRLARLDQQVSSTGDATKAAMTAQRNEVAAARDLLRAGHIRAYGYRCICTPSEVTSVSSKAKANVRAAERSERGTPIPPKSPVRDKIIASEGRYGRA